jgi:hypothetical protein
MCWRRGCRDSERDGGKTERAMAYMRHVVARGTFELLLLSLYCIRFVASFCKFELS